MNDQEDVNEHGFLTGDASRRLTPQVNALLARLRPHARELVAGCAIPGALLCAHIGTGVRTTSPALPGAAGPPATVDLDGDANLDRSVGVATGNRDTFSAAGADEAAR